MKKIVLFLFATICGMAVSDAAPERKMLEEGKTWYYNYVHFEERETPNAQGDYYDRSDWMSYYQLMGDTVIEDRQYMKMYRMDDYNWTPKYVAALREDEEGRVYWYNYNGDKKDFLLIDFSLKGYSLPDAKPIIETIEQNGQMFRRYRYEYVDPDGSTYTMGIVAVEGVGFEGKGLMHYLFEPQPDCICDYEYFAGVSCPGCIFSASAFNNPKIIELSEDEQKLVDSNNDFAFNLFRRARLEESCLLSPLSITYALGMLNNGAAGQTQEEINKTLGFGEAGADAINAFCRKMLDDADALDPKTQALIANTIFVNEGMGYRLQDGFVEKANAYYDAQPQNRDFNDGQTMDVINQWASDHTNGFIKEVLNEGNFNPYAISYLLNALYFKGIWSSPFDAVFTREESFGNGPAVPMMYQYSKFLYTENELYQAVNLPYGNGAYQMTVYLPKQDKSLDDVLESLNSSNWQLRNHERYWNSDVDLKLPRFETENNINLAKVMSDLGMPKAFSGNAEFPYFCNTSAFIGNMFQVAKIKLDEQGTEAAAVTVIEPTTSIPSHRTFHANRPFIYVISEKYTGAIFFIGQYTGGVKVKVKDYNSIAAPQMKSQSTQDEHLYNLAGQRLEKAPARGLYIKNGKVVVK